MSTDGYLRCHHCGCEFLGNKGQIKRAHNNPDQRSYCSKLCQSAKQGEQNRRPYPYTGTCPTCGRDFGSRAPKKFCSRVCYTTSDDFQRRIRELQPKATRAGIIKRTGEEPGDPIELSCLQCGKDMTVPHNQASRKYCSRRCYRRYMADRFDRWIASPQSIALPQNYDEFMLQEELPCLVEGCDWSGKNLSTHVNFSHGITARDFKRAAGFNVGTGLVTAELSEAIGDRPHLHENPFNGATGVHETGRNDVRSYSSLEGREHLSKAFALKLLSFSDIADRTCGECGKTFRPGPLSHSQVYCSVSCRYISSRKTNQAARYELTCCNCHRKFKGNIYQYRRVKGGLRVCCSQHCKGIVAGSARALSRGYKLRNRS